MNRIVSKHLIEITREGHTILEPGLIAVDVTYRKIVKMPINVGELATSDMYNAQHFGDLEYIEVHPGFLEIKPLKNNAIFIRHEVIDYFVMIDVAYLVHNRKQT